MPGPLREVTHFPVLSGSVSMVQRSCREPSTATSMGLEGTSRYVAAWRLWPGTNSGWCMTADLNRGLIQSRFSHDLDQSQLSDNVA